MEEEIHAPTHPLPTGGQTLMHRRLAPDVQAHSPQAFGALSPCPGHPVLPVQALALPSLDSRKQERSPGGRPGVFKLQQLNSSCAGPPAGSPPPPGRDPTQEGRKVEEAQETIRLRKATGQGAPHSLGKTLLLGACPSRPVYRRQWAGEEV